MAVELSVIICSHNPRQEYLDEVLDTLRRQTLAYSEWELLIIDNSSSTRLERQFDVSWHPHGRHILEPKLGLTHARLRGISEAQGEVLVFVDDDNILAVDYLKIALEISERYSFLGAWGGSQIPRYEREPEPWAKHWLWQLATRHVREVRWTNIPFAYEATPTGAGMCLRRCVGKIYCERTLQNKDRCGLDRRGESLMSCGDHDMAFTSRDLDLGFGVFPELSLTHLIPSCRLDSQYLAKLYEANVCSKLVLRAIRGIPPPRPKKTVIRAFRNWISRRRMSPIARLFAEAQIRGTIQGTEIALQIVENQK